MRSVQRLSAAAPEIVAGLFMMVMLCGLAGAALPSFGYLPALGGVDLSLDPFRSLLDIPGIWKSAALALWIGLAASVLSFLMAITFVGAWSETAAFRTMLRMIAPLLSVPHAATAIALAFMFAPSGFFLRLLSPWATGLTTSPDVLIIQDPAGFSMIAGLVAKEVPFLLLVIVAALPQADATKRAEVAASLGYGPFTGWIKTVFPSVYRQIRLPIYAVIAYATSSVDVALILGPTSPPTLGVRLTQLMSDPDLSTQFTAAAAAVLQLLMTLVAFLIWFMGETLIGQLSARAAIDGRRKVGEKSARLTSLMLACVAAASVMFGFVGLLISSVSGPWRFPDALPQTFGLNHWQRALSSGSDILVTTTLISLSAVAVSIVLVIAVLEAGNRPRSAVSGLLATVLYAPLLVPQASFMFGLKSAFLQLGLGPTAFAVLLAHIVFVLPYVYLALAAPWNAWDRRFGIAATSLGSTPWRVLWAVRLPMLTAPILAAMALGFAVSIGQYLPTIIIGSGRVETITTEAVALAAGGNRQIIGVYAALQSALPLLAFVAAILAPRVIFRNRAGMKGWR